MLLTCAAGAANVGTIDNGYPGDTEAQAQMLCDLGLFRGTENGFELEKPMTRAEAAAMLTRLLGAKPIGKTAARKENRLHRCWSTKACSPRSSSEKPRRV